MANRGRSMVGALVLISVLQCISAVFGAVSIKALPKTVNVTVHLKDGGALCTDQAVGSSCLTTYDAVVDSIPVSYVATGVKGATSVSLYACFSKKSTFDRPWRKPSDNPKADKSCPYLIKKGLPVKSGDASWTPHDETPTATFYIRAYIMCPGSNGSPVACATGVSKGFFQVNKENQVPRDLLGSAIGCMFVGPLCLGGYAAYASMKKKH